MALKAPTTDHLSRIYYELEKIGARSVGQKKPWPYHPKTKEGLYCLAADWSRFDPRLLEVLVQFGMTHWTELSPYALRRELKEMETPQTMGVIASFLETENPKDDERLLFWKYVTSGLKPVETQFYFRDLYSPGSHLAERAAKEGLLEFKRWGFLSRERIVVDPATKRSIGSWDQDARLNILRRLFRQNKKIQISDYLEGLQDVLSRQQALLDLKLVHAILKGKGRSAYWVLPETSPLPNPLPQGEREF